MIYVHVPFCRSFCTYCDFYSEVAAKCRQNESELFDAFAQALYAEVKARGHEITDETNTLYIGGGTPSVLPLSVFKGLLDALSEAGHGGPYEEFTVEVNPEDIVEKGEAYVEGLLKLGVNRISMGVQSFDDGILKFMNRRHDADTARRAYAVLENAGVRNISIDLIFGLSQLSDEQWADTLKKALEISPSGVLPQHISSYQLSVEPGSMLARMVEKGMWSEASDELCERQYRILCETLAHAGYHHYEISNFALPGHEAVHNSAYWRHVPYVGLGPGAHSYRRGCVPATCHPRLGGATAPQGVVAGVAGTHSPAVALRMWNKPDLKGYIADPCGIQEHEVLDDEQLVLEKVMLALRTSEGISEKYLYEHCDNPAVKRAFAAGDLEHTASGNVRIPENRFFVSDSIISEIV